MTEQIISNLAKLPNLKVISRTSVMKYKDMDKTIPEIGNELNVAHVLEGSIRKFGNRIRVTAQLIKTKDDFHIWTENYDREYKEFFDIQDDVSERIATNLLATLTRQDKSQIKTKRAANTEAFEYYLKGKYFHLNRYFNTLNIDDFKTSELMLKKAIEFDPNYAPSYAELADLYNSRYNMVAKSEEEKDKYLKLQEKYINEGYQLEPNSAEILTVKGYIYVAKNEMENAYNSYKRAYSIQPNASGLNYAVGRFYTLRGLWKLAIKYFSRSIEINPLSSATYSEQSRCYIELGEIEKAKIDAQKALEIFPESRSALYLYAYVLIRKKEYDKAEIIMKNREERWPDLEPNQFLKAMLLAALGEEKKAFDIQLSPGGKFILHGFLQNKEKCIEYLNDNFERHKQSEYSLYDRFINNPTYKFLHSNPRFQEILAKHKKLYEENLAKYGDIDI